MPTLPKRVATYRTKWRDGIKNQQFSTATGTQTKCQRCDQDVLKIEPKPGWVVIVNDDGHLHWPHCPGRE